MEQRQVWPLPEIEAPPPVEAFCEVCSQREGPAHMMIVAASSRALSSVSTSGGSVWPTQEDGLHLVIFPEACTFLRSRLCGREVYYVVCGEVCLAMLVYEPWERSLQWALVLPPVRCVA